MRGRVATIWVAGAAVALACSAPQARDADDLWLDAVDSERSREWVAAHNRAALDELGSDPRFAGYESEAAAILSHPERVAWADPVGDHAYGYWQDAAHPHGVWRRAALAGYLAGRPEWETLLDLDALSQREARPWFLAGTLCRLPESSRCLLLLAPRSTDARVVREFDVEARAFVDGGFELPEAKSRVWWEDADTLLVATDFGADSLTRAGYPRSVRRWKRGTPLAAATPVFEIDAESTGVEVRFIGAAGPGSFVGVRPLSFFEREFTLVLPSGEREPLPLPRRAVAHGGIGDRLLMRLEQDWSPAPGAEPLPQGALVQISRPALFERRRIEAAGVVYRPEPGEAVREVVAAGERLYLGLLRGYRSRVLELSPGPARGAWTARPLALEGDFLSLHAALPDASLLVAAEGLLSPPRLLRVGPGGDSRELARGPELFDTAGLVSELLSTSSADGTEISYTVMHRADLKLDASHPTLVYAYGGYDVAITPRYEALFGKLWLEKGGVYVHAYLRGGGERGPAWHQTAMLRNRQQPYDDMIAVLEDLQRRGYSAPARTGIMGRSNGGLMVAVVMEQRPELMAAVVVGGPLIDMLRYHLTGPGPSWTGEYGDPRDPAAAAFLASYSPYQNARAGVEYPVPLVITSTWDDRVLPGHARRFVARLEALGHQALYYEDEQGGHYWELAGGPHPGDWRLRARARAVEFSYLARRLGNDPR